MLSYPRYAPALALLASVLVSPAAGQLSTKCNPTLKTCPPDPAFGTAHTFYFNSTPPDDTFTSQSSAIEYDDKNGAAFTIAGKGQSATLVSNFYFFFGRTEVIMKAARGQGVISSIVWGSDTLDEVDWEFKGGNETFVFSNYFGKGRMNDTTTGGDHKISGSIHDFHNYTSVWTKDKLEWHIDGNLIRTLLPKDANNTNNFPQSPMSLRLGSWVGGDSSQPVGTIAWAGGPTDYSQAPFTMYVQSARVEDYSSGKEYTYGDNSGSWQSIKITEGNSTAAEIVNKPPQKSISEKWAELPSGTRIGIYAAAAAVGGLLFIALLIYSVKQRRQGQREAALAAKMHEEERVELERFKKEGRNPDKLNFDGVAYDGSVGKGGMLSTYSSVPDSPPGSSAGPPEKTWDPTGSDGMVSGMRSTVPLLHGGSADHPQSPGLPPPFPPPASPVNRGFSTSPRAPSRAGSTGPQAGGYSDRVNSPAPGSPHRSPSSPAPHDVYGMSRLNSPGPMLNRGPGSPGPRGGQNGGPGGNSEGGYWNNGGYR